MSCRRPLAERATLLVPWGAHMDTLMEGEQQCPFQQATKDPPVLIREYWAACAMKTRAAQFQKMLLAAGWKPRSQGCPYIP